MEAKHVRKGEIEGKRIFVYDDLVNRDMISRIKGALDQAGFQRNEIARPDTGQYRHWANNMPVEAARKLPLYRPTLLATEPFCTAETHFQVYRSYTNYASYGDMLFTHTDCLPGAGELTALWFIADEWDPEWGGETLFFNRDLDAEFVVSPRPGRLVLFDGEITHCGRPPNRICFAARYTLAFKLEPVSGDGA